MAAMDQSTKLYRQLVKIYPKQYRAEFEDEMVYVFAELLTEAKTTEGRMGVVRLWGRTLGDVGVSAMKEHLSNTDGGDMQVENKDVLMHNRIFVWIAGIVGLLLLVPYWASQWTQGVDWSLGDYAVMGVLLYVMGSLFVLLARRFSTKRWLVGLGVFLLFLYLWAELAVGVFLSWGS